MSSSCGTMASCYYDGTIFIKYESKCISLQFPSQIIGTIIRGVPNTV